MAVVRSCWCSLSGQELTSCILLASPGLLKIAGQNNGSVTASRKMVHVLPAYRTGAAPSRLAYTRKGARGWPREASEALLVDCACALG